MQIVEKLKNNNEDFEFYPTTDEIIFSIIKDLKQINIKYEYSHRFSFDGFLDIGAGNGKVLNSIKKEFAVKCYGIEKAETLKELINQDVFIVGTDFEEQNLIDKNISVTFSNPPYKKFVDWSCKIIRESCSKFIYLVIPQRWKDSQLIKDSIKFRNAKSEVIGKFDFLNSEDRKSRSVVELVCISFNDENLNPFEKSFYQEYEKLEKSYNCIPDEVESNREKENKFSSLVIGDNYVKTIVQLYNDDINKIKKTYLQVKELDPVLLKEFDISPNKIMELLKDKLKGLKNLYWHELIDRMKEITDRLTKNSRSNLINVLNENGYVDFTESNIYAVVLWILKNASIKIDEQLIEIYEELISKANCKNYKSNKKVFEYDCWRYNEEKPSHIFLDYRLVVTYWGSLKRKWDNEFEDKISNRTCDHLKDLLTIANNLGFKCSTDDCRLHHYLDVNKWYPGKPQTFDCYYKGKTITLFECKAHKNGNLHIRLNQKFALALNVEYGRLKGWIHSGKKAAEEMNEPEAVHYFKTNFTLLKSPFVAIENKVEEIKDIPVIPEIKRGPVDIDKVSNFNSEQVSLFKKLYMEAG